MNLTSTDILAMVKGQPAEAAVRAQLGLVDEQKPKRAKYGNQVTLVDGIRFDSKKEANFYIGLKTRLAAGDIQRFARQVRFTLAAGVEYVCDFYVWENDGRERAIDIKSPATQKDKVYRLKKRQAQQLHHLKIEEL